MVPFFQAFLLKVSTPFLFPSHKPQVSLTSSSLISLPEKHLTGRTNQSPKLAYKMFSCCLLLTPPRLKHFPQYPIHTTSAYVHLYVGYQILHPQTHSVPVSSMYVQQNDSYNKGRHLACGPTSIVVSSLIGGISFKIFQIPELEEVIQNRVLGRAEGRGQ